MNNPIAITYVNEHIRPMAERLRALKAMLDADLQTWAAVSALFTPSTDVVEDGREPDGVSRLLCSEVTAFVAVLNQLKTRFDAAGVAATIDKPCVRAMTVS